MIVVDAPKRPRHEVGAVAMEPWAVGEFTWADPSRGELANAISFFAEINGVPEDDVQGVRFFDVALPSGGAARCARYWLRVYSDG